MGPSNRRTTSISASKLRSLRIMLLSRSRRHKTRNNFQTTTTKVANKLNNNNDCNTNQNAITTTTTTTATSKNLKNNKKLNARNRISAVNKMYTSRMRLYMQEDEEAQHIAEDEEEEDDDEMEEEELEDEEEDEEEEDEEEEEEETVEVEQKTEMLEPKVENMEIPDTTTNEAIQQEEQATATTSITTTTTTATTTTTTNNTNITPTNPTCTQQQQQQQQQQTSEKVFYDNRIKRKNVLALNEKVAAIREYEKMPVYKRIGRMFQCSPDQIKRIVQQKESILKAWEQRTRRCQDAKTLEMKVVRVSMLGKAVYDWIRRMMYYKDFMITDGLIQKMALQFKSAMGLQNFFPHQDWCDKFRQTYKINEHDSKLLQIGYTQGHSVQIKDIIKDVLSECTPDLRTCDNNTMSTTLERENGEMFMQQQQQLQQSQQQQQQKIKTPKLLTKCLKQERKMEDVASVSNSLVATNTNTNVALTNSSKTTMRHLQLPQLVTLPRGLANMPQKILVATPISTATTVTAANAPTSTPMTMTIIPLATITQPNSLIAANTKRVAGRIVPPPMVEIKREIKEERRDDEEQQTTTTIATTPATVATTTTATTTTAAATTTTGFNIKEEIISDDEEAEEALKKNLNAQNLDLQQRTTTTTTATTLAATSATTSVKCKDNLQVINKQRIPSPPGEGDDTMDSMDYENLALSSLKKIMQNKAAAISTTPPTITTTTNLTTTKPLVAKMSMRNTPTLTLTPIENLRATTSVPLPPMVALSQLARVPVTNNNGQLPPMPPLQLLPPLTKAPAKHLTQQTQTPQSQQQLQQPQTLPALIPRAYATNVIQSANVVANAAGTACTPLYSLGYRLPQKRKLYDDSVPLTPIKSCSEARRYLKLLEDFALFRENYRLIGLITRADEVLRELDGDDDVDVD